MNKSVHPASHICILPRIPVSCLAYLYPAVYTCIIASYNLTIAYVPLPYRDTFTLTLPSVIMQPYHGPCTLTIP